MNSCPTSGLLGCCTQTVGGITAETCYYADDAGLDSASSEDSACKNAMGTWSTTQ